MQVIQVKDDSVSNNGGGSEVMRKDHLLDPKGSDSGYTLKESNGKMWHIRDRSHG